MNGTIVGEKMIHKSLRTPMSKFFFTFHFILFRQYETLIGKFETFLGVIEGEGN
jgi:hypothetical protein